MKICCIVTLFSCLLTIVFSQQQQQEAPQLLNVELRPIVSNIFQPTTITFGTLPGCQQRAMFVAAQEGVIYFLPQNSTDGSFDTPRIMMDLRRSDDLKPLDPSYDERGLIGFALHPLFCQNGRFYVYFSQQPFNGANTTSHPSCFGVEQCEQETLSDHIDSLEEWQLSMLNSNTTTAPVNQTQLVQRVRTIFRINHTFPNHNGINMLTFDHGMLHLGIGDGGCALDPFENAQNSEIMQGKIHMINVDGISQDNASCNFPVRYFAEFRALCPNISKWWTLHSMGIRNPSGLAFFYDSLPANASSSFPCADLPMSTYGKMSFVDVGQDTWEEVNIVDIQTSAGRNYGWDRFEGYQCNENATGERCPANDNSSIARTCEDIERKASFPVAVISHFDARLGSPAAVLGGRYFRDRSGSCPSFLETAYVFGALASEKMSEPNGKLYLTIPTPDTSNPIGINPNSTTNANTTSNSTTTSFPMNNTSLTCMEDLFSQATNAIVNQNATSAISGLNQSTAVPSFTLPLQVTRLQFDVSSLPANFSFFVFGASPDNSRVFVGGSQTQGPGSTDGFIWEIIFPQCGNATTNVTTTLPPPTSTPATTSLATNVTETVAVTTTPATTGLATNVTETVAVTTTPATTGLATNETTAPVTTGGTTGAVSGNQTATTFNFIVATKTPQHPFFGQGFPLGFIANGVQGDTLRVRVGVTYTFTNNAECLHPLYISTSNVGTGLGIVTRGVVYPNGNQNGVCQGASLTFTPTADQVDIPLFYECMNHPMMGSRILVVPT